MVGVGFEDGSFSILKIVTQNQSNNNGQIPLNSHNIESIQILFLLNVSIHYGNVLCACWHPNNSLLSSSFPKLLSFHFFLMPYYHNLVMLLLEVKVIKLFY